MKKSKKIWIAIALVLAGAFIDGFMIEPNMLIVKNENIPYTDYVVDGKLKIVQFTDVHLVNEENIGYGYSIERFSQLVDKINAENPDIVLFTGDLIDTIYKYNDVEKASAELSRIKSKYGNYAVGGNHDYGGGGSRNYTYNNDSSNITVYENIITQGGFTLLANESVIVNTHVGDIVVSGLDDLMFRGVDYSNIYKGDDMYHIVMAHEPDTYEYISEYNINLLLAGHTHGGQVRLPIIGAVLTPPYGKKYIDGMYEEDETNIYVSSGIGTTHLPVRFFNPPSYTVFEIGN